MNRFIFLVAILVILDPYLQVTASEKASSAASEAATNAPTTAAQERLSGSRLAIEKAIEYFRQLSTNDVDGLFAPPLRERKVVDYKEVTMSFKKIQREIPLYEMRKVEVYANKKVGDSVDAVGVRQKVVTHESTGKKIGTQKIEEIVQDPKGDIHRTVKQPIFGPGGPDIWPYGYFGHNAMVIHAMMKGGVDPADPLIIGTADKLLDIFNLYGLPDNTWDLAWLTAALSGMKGDSYTNVAVRAAAKLMDGQITTGPAAGMWGPVCINTKLVGTMMDNKQDLDELYLKLTAATKKQTDIRLKGKNDPEQVLSQIRGIAAKYRDASMIAFITQKLESRVRLAEEGRGDAPKTIVVAGYTQHMFNQTAADLDSTALALYALRIAQDHGLLPETINHPVDSKNKPFLPWERARNVLSRGASALLQAQARTNVWTEMNIHQPVTDFSGMKGLAGIPAKAKAFPPLESPTTFCSTAQGYSSLLNMQLLLGGTNLSPNVKSTLDQLQQAISRVDESTITNLNGGYIAPYDAFFHSSVGAPGLGDDTRRAIVAALVDSQAADGSWEKKRKKAALLVPTSYAKRMQVLDPIAQKGDKLKDEDFADVHVWVSDRDKNQRWGMHNTYGVRADILATAYGLLALSWMETPPVQGN